MAIDIAHLHETLKKIVRDVRHGGDLQFARWKNRLPRAEFAESARNLACYLALRHHDLRPLQHSLTALGLSSLGRLESRVLPTLEAVKATLAALSAGPAEERPSEERFFAGEERLRLPDNSPRRL